MNSRLQREALISWLLLVITTAWIGLFVTSVLPYEVSWLGSPMLVAATGLGNMGLLSLISAHKRGGDHLIWKMRVIALLIAVIDFALLWFGAYYLGFFLFYFHYLHLLVLPIGVVFFWFNCVRAKNWQNA